ncbi:hypothetical protein QJS04_geneDACA018343 [Acorus gramineus]|uniref:Uncharacterized protein n=1 Tax=Acorus gramineus TaxID=55184 RepID=A0AAV9A1X6_ACOGR|nr:hypothetical protein QJS04_geneDACA018343 [Acorus gramineus]
MGFQQRTVDRSPERHDEVLHSFACEYTEAPVGKCKRKKMKTKSWLDKFYTLVS